MVVSGIGDKGTEHVTQLNFHHPVVAGYVTWSQLHIMIFVTERVDNNTADIVTIGSFTKY